MNVCEMRHERHLPVPCNGIYQGGGTFTTGLGVRSKSTAHERRRLSDSETQRSGRGSGNLESSLAPMALRRLWDFCACWPEIFGRQHFLEHLECRV